MDSDYAVWDIDGVLVAYRDIPDWQANIEAGYKALFLFMEENGLLNCRVTNEAGEVVKRVIKVSEITEEGRKLSWGAKSATRKWMKSKARQKSPPDMKALEKALAEIRSGH